MDVGQGAPLVPSLVSPYDAYWLAAGGALGALARGLWTSGQKNWGLETGQDVIIGAACGLLWNLNFTIPGVGLTWPLIPLPVHATPIQRAALVAVITMVTVAVTKRLLFAVVPAYMAKFASHLPGGQSNGTPGGPVPPSPGAGSTLKSLALLCASATLLAGCATAAPPPAPGPPSLDLASQKDLGGSGVLR